MISTMSSLRVGDTLLRRAPPVCSCNTLQQVQSAKERNTRFICRFAGDWLHVTVITWVYSVLQYWHGTTFPFMRGTHSCAPVAARANTSFESLYPGLWDDFVLHTESCHVSFSLRQISANGTWTHKRSHGLSDLLGQTRKHLSRSGWRWECLTWCEYHGSSVLRSVKMCRIPKLWTRVAVIESYSMDRVI